MVRIDGRDVDGETISPPEAVVEAGGVAEEVG